MKVSIDKTKSLIISKQHMRCKLEIDKKKHRTANIIHISRNHHHCDRNVKKKIKQHAIQC